MNDAARGMAYSKRRFSRAIQPDARPRAFVNSPWFSCALAWLDRYKTETERYLFPKEMIAEQKDSYVYNGGHMNPGESRKNKRYA